MKVAVVGTGHVGLVTAASLAHVGHDVVGFDDDRDKIEGLRSGVLPFFEEGLAELVAEGQASGRLRFVQDPAHAVAGVDVAFICVGTPGSATGETNLLAVEHAAHAIGAAATGDMVVVEKSTVPVQTANRVRTLLNRTSPHSIDVASNPEFLREGRAVEDSLRPSRILVGADSPSAHAVLRRLYDPIVALGATYYATDVMTAELAKHACNAFLALKISFANGLARICEAAGADVVAVADVMGSDPRIGREFLDAGLGWGGYCFPKDLAAFRAQSSKLGYDFRILDEIRRINDEAIDSTFGKIRDALWNLENKRVVLLGLAFKAGTDDTRGSPAIRLARRLMEAGAHVVGCDPKAGAAARVEVPELTVREDLYAAAEGAHCLVVCTNWPEYRAIDLARLKGLMSVPVMVDGRNMFEPEVMRQAGFTYVPTGRPAVNQ